MPKIYLVIFFPATRSKVLAFHMYSLKRYCKWCFIYQNTSFAKWLTIYRTWMFIALLRFTVLAITVLSTMLWWWTVTLSTSFTSSSTTGDTAFSPLSPIRPSSINCSMNSNVKFVCKSIQTSSSHWASLSTANGTCEILYRSIVQAQIQIRQIWVLTINEQQTVTTIHKTAYAPHAIHTDCTRQETSTKSHPYTCRWPSSDVSHQCLGGSWQRSMSITTTQQCCTDNQGVNIPKTNAIELCEYAQQVHNNDQFSSRSD